MRQSYETLTAAIRARQWVRSFTKRHSRVPTADERGAWIARETTIAHHMKRTVDFAYVSRACDNAHAVPFNPNIEV